MQKNEDGAGNQDRPEIAARPPPILLYSVRYKRKQGDMPRAFDGFSDHALMMCAGSCDTSWDDFAALGNEFGPISSQYHLFVINAGCFVYAKHTDLTTRFAKLVRFTAGRSAGRSARHVCPVALSLDRGCSPTRYSSAKGSDSSISSSGGAEARGAAVRAGGADRGGGAAVRAGAADLPSGSPLSISCSDIGSDSSLLSRP